MSGRSCPSPTCTETSTASVTRLWSAMGKSRTHRTNASWSEISSEAPVFSLSVKTKWWLFVSNISFWHHELWVILICFVSWLLDKQRPNVTLNFTFTFLLLYLNFSPSSYKLPWKTVCFIFIFCSLSALSCLLCQVHVCVRRLLRCAAQRCACLPTPQLPGFLGRGGVCEGWARGPLCLEQRPMSPLGTQHG